MYRSEVEIDNGSLKALPMSECNELKTYGRCIRDIEHVVLFWTASGIEINIKASEVWMEVESTYSIYEPWITISVNGAQISRMMLPKGRYYIPLIRNMNKDEPKTIRIYKDAQAMSADEMHGLRIFGFLTDGELLPLPEKKLKLEFIGDSITSGEGARGAKQENDWIPMLFDSANGYPTLVAEALDADYNVISQSGWGTLTGWDNNPSCALPIYYDKLCGLAFGERNEKLGAHVPFDFGRWSADCIIINLGTNDGGAFHSPLFKDPVTGRETDQRMNEDGSFNEEDLQKLQDAVKLFIAQLRYLNPMAKLLWVYGMLGNEMEPTILEAIDSYVEDTEDRNVYYMSLPDTNDETVGSRSHPGPKAHAIAAKLITKKIKEILKLEN